MTTRSSRGFGAAKHAPSPFDVSFGVTRRTQHLLRPHAVVTAHTPEGEQWLAGRLDAIKERCEQVWDDNSKAFLFDAFAAFTLQACNCGLAVRVGVRGGQALIANPDRETKPAKAFGGLR